VVSNRKTLHLYNEIKKKLLKNVSHVNDVCVRPAPPPRAVVVCAEVGARRHQCAPRPGRQVNSSSSSSSAAAAMDSNKDEAARCLHIARSAISGGHADKARRFLEKAQRLFPTEQARGTAAAGRRGPAAGSQSEREGQRVQTARLS